MTWTDRHVSTWRGRHCQLVGLVHDVGPGRARTAQASCPKKGAGEIRRSHSGCPTCKPGAVSSTSCATPCFKRCLSGKRLSGLVQGNSLPGHFEPSGVAFPKRPHEMLFVPGRLRQGSCEGRATARGKHELCSLAVGFFKGL